MKKTRSALWEFSWEATQANSVKRLKRGVNVQVLTMLSPAQRPPWLLELTGESELHSNVHQAPSADLSLVIPSLLLCAAPMFDPLAVSQLCSFLSNLVFLHKCPLCWNVLPLHQPQLLST